MHSYNFRDEISIVLVSNDKLMEFSPCKLQFVNFNSIMSKYLSPTHKEAAFALAALMEIPIQYSAVTELGLLGYIYTPSNLWFT